MKVKKFALSVLTAQLGNEKRQILTEIMVKRKKEFKLETLVNFWKIEVGER